MTIPIITLLALLSGFVAGVVASPLIREFTQLEERAQHKSIQETFNCQPNEFLCFKEGVDNYYIVSVHNKEYRVTFAKKRPCKIVFCQEVAYR